jgi:hypothetical protein
MDGLRLEHAGGTTPDAAAGPALRGASPIEELRRLHRGLTRTRTEDFDVPGYAGRFVARYRRLSFEEYRDAFSGDGGVVARNTQFLIDALAGLYYRDEDGELHDLAQFTGLPDVAATWTDFVSLLDDVEPAPTAVEQVLQVFAGDELVLNQHSAAVDQWMTGVKQADDDAFAGGS